MAKLQKKKFVTSVLLVLVISVYSEIINAAQLTIPNDIGLVLTTV